VRGARTLVAYVPGRQGGHQAPDGEPAGDFPPAAVRVTAEQAAPSSAAATRDATHGRADGSERRTWADPAGCRIVACVDVAPVGADDSVPTNVLWGLAVRRMERCVRPGDWICLLGGGRLAVCFGNGAHRIAPSALGRRLARAMGDHLAVGTASARLDVAVGVGVAADLEPWAVTEMAMASVRSARHRPGRALGPARRLVSVARAPDAHRARRARLVRRVLVTVDDEARDAAQGGHEAVLSGHGAEPARPRRRDAAMRVLVVDPEPTPPRASRLGCAAVASVARRVGAIPTVSTASAPDAVLLDHHVVEPHAVVMVLHPEPSPPQADRRTDPWEAAARLTKVLREAGSSVLAVSFGASAISVAACVEQGAVGLFDLEALPEELARLVGGHPSAHRSPTGSERQRLPAPYRGLAELTAAERRVLHKMMQGRSAGEIAAEQVVSLSTVRTHIRSILRKLDVSSQLAAVAIANGSIPLEGSIA
jgi:DNA-binding CsgD family transcriptional regulator